MEIIELAVHSTGKSTELAMSKSDHAKMSSLGVKALTLAFGTLEVQVTFSLSKTYLSAPKICWENGTPIKKLTQQQLCERLNLKVGDKLSFGILYSETGVCLESIEYRRFNLNMATDAEVDLDTPTYVETLSRPRQNTFRKKLLELYNGRCAITECEIDEVLEAAHVIPYSEFASINPAHGILLRSDIHRLYDAYLLSINPVDGTVELDSTLAFYHQFAGKEIAPLPNSEFLEIHYQRFKSNS